MHRNQHPYRNLKVFTVKPGPETGLYYILVANLAYETTPDELMKFASRACEVDHAEVYPPTSGFVRVRGRANFEKAFRYLDGNTLEYRALQADGRNLTQDTVVKLLLTDYHAVRIIWGGSVRVVTEPGDPSTEPSEVLSGGMGAITLAGSVYSDYQGNAGPRLNMGDLQWRYATGPQYGGWGYQTGPAVGTIPNPEFVPPAVYHDGRAPIYTEFPPPPGKNRGPHFSTAYDYSPDTLTPTPTYPDFSSNSGSRATAASEPRKILICGLERDRLSEAAVAALLIQYAVERVEIPLNQDGRPRGTAYVTFETAELASAAAAGVDGLRVWDRKVSACVLGYGGSREGSAKCTRPGSSRRTGGGAANPRSGQPAQVNRSVIVSNLGPSFPRNLTTTAATASMSASASTPSLVEHSSQSRNKEERPVIVDGRGGRWKKEPAPVVVNGSGSTSSHGSRKATSGGNRGARR